MIGYHAAECSKIPREPGLYAFYIEPATPAKLGLYRNARHAPEVAEAARLSLVRRIKRLFSVLRRGEMSGYLEERGRGRHIAKSLSLRAEIAGKVCDENKIHALPAPALFDFADALQSITLLSQPVYVGIAVEQTLYQRYQQHKLSFLRRDDSPTNFGGRVREAGLDWDDLVFTCVTLEVRELHEELLRALEWYLQAVAQPVFSKE